MQSWITEQFKTCQYPSLVKDEIEVGDDNMDNEILIKFMNLRACCGKRYHQWTNHVHEKLERSSADDNGIHDWNHNKHKDAKSKKGSQDEHSKMFECFFEVFGLC